MRILKAVTQATWLCSNSWHATMQVRLTTESRECAGNKFSLATTPYGKEDPAAGNTRFQTGPERQSVPSRNPTTTY